MQVNAVLSNLVIAIVIAILVIATFKVGKFTLANLNYYQVKNQTEQWREQQAKPTQLEIKQSLTAIRLANSLHPQNPLYIGTEAELLDWQAKYDKGLDEEGRIALVSKGIVLYQQSLQRRPLWPVSWGSLVMSKWQLQEFDSEMLVYLNNADVLGASTPEIHQLYIELGLALYKGNHLFFSQLAVPFHRRLVLGLSHPIASEPIVTMFSRYDALKIGCIWLRDERDYVKDKLNCLAKSKAPKKSPRKG